MIFLLLVFFSYSTFCGSEMELMFFTSFFIQNSIMEWSRSRERRACFEMVPMASTGGGRPHNDGAVCL